MTTYRLPDVLGGGECTTVEPYRHGPYTRVTVGTGDAAFTIDLDRNLLTEVKPPLPPEPEPGVYAIGEAICFVYMPGASVLCVVEGTHSGWIAWQTAWERYGGPDVAIVELVPAAEPVALLTEAPPPSLLMRAAMALREHAAAATAQLDTGDVWESAAENWLGGPVGEFCALLSPDVALELADLLDLGWGASRPEYEVMLALAHAILREGDEREGDDDAVQPAEPQPCRAAWETSEGCYSGNRIHDCALIGGHRTHRCACGAYTEHGAP